MRNKFTISICITLCFLHITNVAVLAANPLYGYVYNNPPGGEYTNEEMLLTPDLHNVHLHGFGSIMTNPNTIYSRLDRSHNLGVPYLALTISHAPGIYKCGDSSCDWEAEATLTDIVGYFNAAKPIIQKSINEHNVTHIFVGNEMKGFWDKDNNTWNGAAYTQLYNLVWDYVKIELNKPEILIGGPYIPARERCFNRDIDFGGVLVDERDIEVSQYWFDNKNGADYFTFDGGVGGKCEHGGEGTGWWGQEDTKAFVEEAYRRWQLPVLLAEAYTVGQVTGAYEGSAYGALIWAQKNFWPELVPFDTSPYTAIVPTTLQPNPTVASNPSDIAPNNGDGSVNLLDLDYFITNFQQLLNRLDVNQDSQVDLLDYNQLISTIITGN